MSGMRGRERHGPKIKRSALKQDPNQLIRSQTAPLMGSGLGEEEAADFSRTCTQRPKTPQPGGGGRIGSTINLSGSSGDDTGDTSGDDSREDTLLTNAAARFQEVIGHLYERKASARVAGFNTLARILRTVYLGQETLDASVDTLAEYVSRAIKSGDSTERAAASGMCEAFCASLGNSQTFYERVAPAFHSACVSALGSNTTEQILSPVLRAYGTLCYCCSGSDEDTRACMDVFERVIVLYDNEENGDDDDDDDGTSYGDDDDDDYDDCGGGCGGGGGESVSEYALSAALSGWALLSTTVSFDVEGSKNVAAKFVKIMFGHKSLDVRMDALLALGVLFENVRESLDSSSDEDGSDDDDDDSKVEKKHPTLYDCPDWIDPETIESFKKEAAIGAAKKDKATEQRAYRIVASVLLDGTEPEPVSVVVAHKKLVFKGLINRLTFAAFKRIFEDGITAHLQNNEFVMGTLEYEFNSILTYSYSADAEKKADLKRKKDRDRRHGFYDNYDD